MITNLQKLPDLDSEYYKHLQPYQKLVKIEDIIEAKDIKLAKKKEREKNKRKKRKKKPKNLNLLVE